MERVLHDPFGGTRLGMTARPCSDDVIEQFDSGTYQGGGMRQHSMWQDGFGFFGTLTMKFGVLSRNSGAGMEVEVEGSCGAILITVKFLLPAHWTNSEPR